MSNPYLVAGGCVAFTGVLLGALGAHSISDQLSESAMATWQTAGLYHLIHAPALLAIGLFLTFSKRQRKRPLSGREVAQDRDGSKRALALAIARQTRALKFAGFAFVLGVILFSGSLYLLALGGPRALGPLTPIGGVCFLLGWVAVIVAGAMRTDG